MSDLTLKALIELSSLKSVNWVSGGNNLESNVKWVTAYQAEIKPGDLLLLPADENNSIDFIRAHEANAAGILVFGKIASKTDLPDSFPIGSLRKNYDLRHIHQELNTLLLNEQVAVMRQRENIQTLLSQLAVEAEDLQDIVQKIHEISGSGIVVQDKYLITLAESSTPSLKPIWGDVLDFLSLSSNLPDPLRDRGAAGQRPSLYTQSIPGDVARYITPIIVRGVVRGYFSVIKLKDELDDQDRLVAEQGPFIFAAEMSRAKAVRETEKKLHGDLLSALLTHDLDPREASLWVEEMGLDLAQSHTALQFAWDSEDPPSRRRLETIINGEITRSPAKIIVNPMGSDVVCFFQAPSNSARPVEVIAFAQTVLSNAYGEYPEAHARCGIGTPANSLDEWRVSFRYAAQSLEMARKLRESKPLYYPDLSVYRLLILLEDQPDLTRFYTETLGSLIAYKKNKDLITTLQAYFENMQNLSQTAKALFIHRNTLIQRMKRIAEITGLDINNADTRLAVQLSLKIYKMRENNP